MGSLISAYVKDMSNQDQEDELEAIEAIFDAEFTGTLKISHNIAQIGTL